MKGRTTRDSISLAAASAISCLLERRETINKLNVFPVPDGDTGTNFYLTMKAGFEEMERDPASPVPKAAGDLARGALMGCKGISGVILSQFLEGIASGLSESPQPGVPELLRGIEAGVELAYEAVSEPIEGTMLTVIRETAEGMKKSDSKGVQGLLLRAHGLACASLARTPLVLEVLAKAGVVDAGGAGVVTVLEGVVSSLGGDCREFDWEGYTSGPVPLEYEGPRWEIVFTIECGAGEMAELESRIKSLGDSIVSAGRSSPYRVHIHTDLPRQVLQVADAIGETSGIEIIRLMDSE